MALLKPGGIILIFERSDRENLRLGVLDFTKSTNIEAIVLICVDILVTGATASLLAATIPAVVLLLAWLDKVLCSLTLKIYVINLFM